MRLVGVRVGVADLILAEAVFGGVDDFGGVVTLLGLLTLSVVGGGFKLVLYACSS